MWEKLKIYLRKNLQQSETLKKKYFKKILKKYYIMKNLENDNLDAVFKNLCGAYKRFCILQ